MATFSERLRELRNQKGLSQQELGDRTNQTKQSISQYERGIRKPDIEVLSALCDIFNVSMDYLTGKANVTVRFLNSEDLEALNRSKYTLPPQIQRTAYSIYKEAPVIYKVYDSDDRNDLVKHADYLDRRQGLLLNAAHNRTDIEVTPEMIANDEDIMADENF